MTILRPVILCGGSGTRLWPISRGLYPKQFMDMQGETIFGRTLERAMALPEVGRPIIVCNHEHRFFAAAILQKMGIKADIILEPVGRNTAPAIAVAAFSAMQNKDGEALADAVLLVLPSDHAINPQEAFASSVGQALSGAEKGLLVTFGVKPLSPETGFGYIQQGELLAGLSSVYEVKRFIEKPDATKATEMLKDGNYVWNSGMFMFRASSYLNELEKYSPEIFKACKTGWKEHSRDLDFIRLGEAFSSSPSDSIDYSVMERTDKAGVVPLEARWSDLGSWQSMYESMPHDAKGNACLGDVIQLDAEGCYLHSSSRLLTAVGVKDLCVVESADAVLVVERERAQDVKPLLELLKKHNRTEISTHLLVHRPWGSYETLALGPRFQVKRIIVKPGSSLSLQMHHHRSEHWVVVSGTARVTQGEESKTFCEDMSTYIPLGTKHRLENPGIIPLEIIEIQTGAYLGEDDIVRFEDSYGR